MVARFNAEPAGLKVGQPDDEAQTEAVDGGPGTPNDPVRAPRCRHHRGPRVHRRDLGRRRGRPANERDLVQHHPRVRGDRRWAVQQQGARP